MVGDMDKIALFWTVVSFKPQFKLCFTLRELDSSLNGQRSSDTTRQQLMANTGVSGVGPFDG